MRVAAFVAVWACLCGSGCAFLAPAGPLRVQGMRRTSAQGVSMHSQSDGTLAGDISLVGKTLLDTPARLRDEGAKAAVMVLGREVTGTDLYRVWAQGAVIAGLGALHVINPELLQTVGLFHLTVCLPICLAATQAKGHDPRPAVAKTLLVGGLAAAQVLFATDANQMRWPGSQRAAPEQPLEARLDEKLGLTGGDTDAPRFPVKGAVGQRVGDPIADPPAAGGVDASPADQLKTLLAEYGRVGLLVHFGIQFAMVAALWAAISVGGDPDALLASLLSTLPTGVAEAVAAKIDPSAGAFAIAYVLSKVAAPARIAADIAVTPVVAKALRETPLAGVLGLKPEQA